MRNEITAAVLFLVQLIEKNEKFSPDQVDCFRRRLIELLTERFRNHWFPDKPFKGQGYRCIRVNGNSRRDETLERAATAAGVKYEDLSLPVELTLWVDPHEVCCRFGESKGSYCTLASFGKEDIDQGDDHEKENKSTEEFNLKQENSHNIINHHIKSKPLSVSNQNQQPNNNNTNNRRRNTNSPRFQITKNRSWINNSFSMDHTLHPMSHPWYNVMSPHFLGYPPPRQFIGHRPNKWVNHLPCYSSKPTRSYSRPFKPTVKV